MLKARTRGTRTLDSVAAELNMSLGTLKGWLKRSRHTGPASLPADMPALQWTPAQRLLALHESHALQGPALHAWCRERGLFEHQLIQWREIFCTATQPAAASTAEQRTANTAMRELQSRHDQLQRQIASNTSGDRGARGGDRPPATAQRLVVSVPPGVGRGTALDATNWPYRARPRPSAFPWC